MKTLIAVHYQIVRDGITRILTDDPEITVSKTAHREEQICVFLADNEIDVVIVDLDMPDLDGTDTIAEIHNTYPDSHILAISNDVKAARIKSVLQAGASGFICKKRSADELIEASKEVYNGNQYLCDESISLLIDENKDKSSESAGNIAGLTEREKEVLELICEEYINREIADLLGISVRTVDAHRRNLLQKTGVKNTAGLVKFAIKHRLFIMS